MSEEAQQRAAWGDGDGSDEEPMRLEQHVNAAEYWLDQADIYAFPNEIRVECLKLAAIHAELAGALARVRELTP